MVRFHRYVLILGGLCALTFAALLTPLAAFGSSHYATALYTPPYPFLDPVDEVRLQAAMRAEMPGIGVDEQLKRLRGIEIRTALEDTARLHYELG